MENNSLTHWGIKGMKWGIRRFQNKDGSLTAAGRKRLKKTSEEKTEQTKEEYEAAKQKALKSGKAGDILKYKGDLTNNEMQTALTRLSLEKQLGEIQAKEVKRGIDKIEATMNKVEKLNSAVEKGVKAYNTFAKISNSFLDIELPSITDKSKIEKEKEKSEKAKEKAKKKLMQEGSPEDIAKNFSKFTTNDLQEITKRMNYQAQITKKAEEAKAAREAAKKESEKDD